MVIKWAIGVLGAIIVLLGLAIGGVWAKSNQILNNNWDVPVVEVKAHGDLIRGERMVYHLSGCAECHGSDLKGNTIMDNFPMGKIIAPPITAAALKDWTDQDLVRAIHHGIDRQGKALVLMPAEEYAQFSEEDLASVIAYLRTAPGEAPPREESQPGPLFRTLMTAGEIKLAADKITHQQPLRHQSELGDSPEAKGKYIAETACMGCHGTELKGGTIPGGDPAWPEAANLTLLGQQGWQEADFAKAMHEGIRPNGETIAAPMIKVPYNDQEITALWAYIQSLPAADKASPAQ